MEIEKAYVKVDCKEILDREVKMNGDTGCIYVPNEYVGKKVYVLIRK